MNWLLGPIITSIVASILIYKIWDFLSGGMTNSITGIARLFVLVGAWAAIITAFGMRRVTNLARRIIGSGIVKRLRTLAGGERS